MPSGHDGQCVHYGCMKDDHQIKSNQIKNWIFVRIDLNILEFHVCVRVCAVFPSWWTWLSGLTRRWLENFHHWPLKHKNVVWLLGSFNEFWLTYSTIEIIYLSNVNHSKVFAMTLNNFPLMAFWNLINERNNANHIQKLLLHYCNII